MWKPCFERSAPRSGTPVPLHLPRLPIAVVGACGVLVIAGCGASRKPSSTSASGQAPAGVAFSRCMRSHGVPNFPDPSTSGSFQVEISGNHTRVALSDIPGVNPDSPAFKVAQAACQNLIPGGLGPSGPATATAMTQARAWAKCMRAHGVPNFPDPRTTIPSHGPPFNGQVNQINGAVFMLPAATINPQSPAFERAATTCGLPGY
jgi:hypothetical protein